MQSLPIDAVLPELIAALKRSPNAVLQAPTGAGKTTRAAPALLDAAATNSETSLASGLAPFPRAESPRSPLLGIGERAAVSVHSEAAACGNN